MLIVVITVNYKLYRINIYYLFEFYRNKKDNKGWL